MKTVPRTLFVQQLARLTVPDIQSFLRFAAQPDASGAMPCWGALSDRFDAHFPNSAARLAVWRELVELGDRRPQLIFIDLNRERADVLAQVVSDADRLSEPVQRMLITSGVARPFVLRSLAKFNPSARQLLDHGSEALQHERRLQRRTLQKLRHIHFFAPGRLAPEDELQEGIVKPKVEIGAVRPTKSETAAKHARADEEPKRSRRAPARK